MMPFMKPPLEAVQDALAGPFMHSDCALERASPDIPAVCLLHIDILLSALAGLADRQELMNFFRSSPVLPSDFTLQAAILSCCAFCAGVGVASAANAGAAAANVHAAIRINSLFMGFPPKGSTFGMQAVSRLRPSLV